MLKKKPKRPTRRNAFKQPSEAKSELLRELFCLSYKQGVNLRKLSGRAGVSEDTMRDWFYGRNGPTLFNFECALEALGFKLKITKRDG